MTAETPDHPATLADWLAHAERQHPREIALGLERVRVVAHRLRDGALLRPACPLVTVGGTNGKGSTCAMLESIYRQAGYRTALYTSPHLLRFEERARLDGRPLPAATLVRAFAEVEAARLAAGEVALTYFEFTTLALVLALLDEAPQVLILEVGMGGRLDAVNLWDADCAVVTSVDLDHQAYLGPDREAIGYEKAGIARTGRPLIVSDPMPPDSLLARGLEVGAEVRRLGDAFTVGGDRQQWNWRGRSRRYAGLAYPALRGANQLLNAAGALAALEALHERLPVTAQAVRNGLALVEWPGRFQVVPGQPALVLDVAHNPHAVAALAENLDAMGYYPRTVAVLGMLDDKDLRAVLARMAPLVDHWCFTDLPSPRALSAQALGATWEALRAAPQAGFSLHADPAAALIEARRLADPTGRIVVFGSFHTVGGVMQDETARPVLGSPRS